MVKNYRVLIEETISEEFELEAESEKAAISKAIDAYKSGEFVLEPGNFESAHLKVIDENEKCSDWIEI